MNTEITIEEKKRLVEFRGKIVYQRECSKSYVFKRGNVLHLLCNWTPELGDDDLSELLAKLDYEQRGELYYKLPPDTTIPNNFDVDDLMDICLWFQDNKNAPTIVKAILEVIG